VARPTQFESKVDGYIAEGNKQVRSARKTSTEKDDDTRQKVARKFVDFYFGILILIVIGVPFYNYLIFEYTGSTDLVLSFKDAILTYSAVVGPTVGLVVAYYFKNNSGE